MGDRSLFVGSSLDGSGRVALDGDHLTTHAVCVGMTGSGKTGLGIVVLEELARRGVPLLVVDLKGDMVDLLLGFPSLAAEDFEPWLTPDMVAGRNRMEVASEQAALWRGGLERDGLGSADLTAVARGVRWQLLTPGAAVAPLDILPSLAAPTAASSADPASGDTERAGGVAGALLSLIGRGGDPLTDRDHVLVSAVLLERWRRREATDLGALLAALADPPMDALGVLPLERFYPRAERLELVMELNTLVASPAFAAWTTGVPLDMEALLGTEAAPRASIVSIAHLEERQRQFILSLLAAELVAWMRRLPGTGSLRALLYIDELQGLLPPHPASPPTKAPLLTILKQGRAFGLGAWLATQNPVDIDYKALGNAGITAIGRLVTEQDRSRVLDGLGLRETADGRDAARLVASLGKREFLLHDVRAEERTRTFSSRWAMSYLRGPVTLVEMERLARPSSPATGGDERRSGDQPGAAAARRRPPVMGAAVEQLFAARSTGPVEPSLLVLSRAGVSRAAVDLDRNVDELWTVPVSEDGTLDWGSARLLDELPQTVAEPAEGTSFPVALPGRLDGELERAARAFVDWRAQQTLAVLVNSKLKLAAAQGEDREAFVARCLDAADRADDADQERARSRYEKRMEGLRTRLAKERAELAGDRADVRSRRTEEVLGAVESLFSVLLGSRSVRSAGSKAAAKMRSAATKRRMSRRAEEDVDESVREIARIEHELEELGLEMEREVERIARESEERARDIAMLELRPPKTRIAVDRLWLLWS